MKFKSTTKICYTNASLLLVKLFATIPSSLKEYDSHDRRVLSQMGVTLNVCCN